MHGMVSSDHQAVVRLLLQACAMRLCGSAASCHCCSPYAAVGPAAARATDVRPRLLLSAVKHRKPLAVWLHAIFLATAAAAQVSMQHTADDGSNSHAANQPFAEKSFENKLRTNIFEQNVMLQTWG